MGAAIGVAILPRTFRLLTEYAICVDTHIAVQPADDDVAAATEIFKLLADATRLRILWALLHGEHSVGNLAEHVGAQPANVSQHLAKLRLARLVRTRKQGNHVFYLAENAHVRRLVEEALRHADHLVRDDPTHHTGAKRPRSARRPA